MDGLNLSTLGDYPGAIVHVRGTGWISRLIRRAVKSWGNHDALVCKRGVCDAEPLFCKINTFADYQQQLDSGKISIQVLLPSDFSPFDGLKAANFWIANIDGEQYDFRAYIRLIWKSLFHTRWSKPVGDPKDFYCTEGVAVSWLQGAGVDLYGRNNVTPKHTEELVDSGRLVDITDRFKKEG